MPCPQLLIAGRSNDTSCAVCFEPVEQGATLPCACTAAYCNRCWDRSLAQSLNACGRARCPTCRCPVRVEYDADVGKVLFSIDVTEVGLDEMEVEDEGLQRERRTADEDEGLQRERRTADEDQNRASDTSSGLPSSSERHQLVPPTAEEERLRVAAADVDPSGSQPSGQTSPTANVSGQDARTPVATTSRRVGTNERIMERLVEQARPVQLRLLRKHGEDYPLVREAAAVVAAATKSLSACPPINVGGPASPPFRRAHRGPVAPGGIIGGPPENPPAATRKENAALAEQLELLANRVSEVERSLEELVKAVSNADVQPPCVCGSHLRRVSYRERLVRCLKMRMPCTLSLPNFEALVDNVLSRKEPCYFCDLCGESWSEGNVWTCENGNSTILHANAYDVCEKCFAICCEGSQAVS